MKDVSIAMSYLTVLPLQADDVSTQIFSAEQYVEKAFEARKLNTIRSQKEKVDEIFCSTFFVTQMKAVNRRKEKMKRKTLRNNVFRQWTFCFSCTYA